MPGPLRDVTPPENDRAVAMELFWEIDRLSRSFLKIQAHWAREQGISGPQLALLNALNQLGVEGGASVSSIASKLGVDPSFVTTQTKLMEKSGLVVRKPSRDDARVTMISMSTKAHAALVQLGPRQRTMNEFLFEGMPDTALSDLRTHLRALQKRAAKAALLLEIENFV